MLIDWNVCKYCNISTSSFNYQESNAKISTQWQIWIWKHSKSVISKEVRLSCWGYPSNRSRDLTLWCSRWWLWNRLRYVRVDLPKDDTRQSQPESGREVNEIFERETSLQNTSIYVHMYDSTLYAKRSIQ